MSERARKSGTSRGIRRRWRDRKGTWWWAATVIVVPVVLLTAAAVMTLLMSVEIAGPSDRIEVVKTGLTVGAGTGGVVALVLAGRRQLSTEHDMTERRLTDLYVKAVEQLGSEKAAIRHGGLYALERVAQNNPGQRQTVVDVLCAYLRSPCILPGAFDARRLGVKRPLVASPKIRKSTSRSLGLSLGSAPPRPRDGVNDALEEREVRLTAQRILTRHLRPGVDAVHPVETYWSDVDLDLSGATLIDFDLASCTVGTAAFVGATFAGNAAFLRTIFTGSARFDKSTFDADAAFNQAAFAEEAGFVEARFAGHAVFDGARFERDANFCRVSFSADAAFVKARFVGETVFANGLFAGKTWFYEANFAGDADFDRASFVGDVGFRHAVFEQVSHFGVIVFSGPVGFGDASFGGLAIFSGTTFTGPAGFSGATFAEDVKFIGAKFCHFRGPAEFSRAQFHGQALFGQASFVYAPDFADVKFHFGVPFELKDFIGCAAVGDGSPENCGNVE